MGVTTTDNDEQVASDMTAAKPKERQFQVVPVPGTFTRGRWKCWDYKDKTSETGAIIDFTDKSEKHSLPINVGENPTGCRTFIPHGQTDTMNHMTTEPHLIPATDTSSAAISQAIDISNAGKESSTIVVTSIAPPSATPVHGTPSSASTSPVINNATIIETKGKIPDHEDSISLQTTASAPVLNVGGVAPAHTLQFYRAPSATTSHLQPLSELPDPNLVVQSSFVPEPVATNIPLTVAETDDLAATSTSTTGQNVVPIDNKIEQAMDLVKTHLTFAVREEVEILRSTIVELEAKVAQLESQNQVLKQFAPVEVVNSLAVLVQQQQQRQLQLQQQQLSSGATSPNPAQPVTVQNVPISVQGIQKQSMSAMTSEISVGPASLQGVVPPVGLLSQIQPSVEQKQAKQLPATGNIVGSDLQ
ncbi:TSC22 domain family protein 1 [Loa loa]|uniref:TSC22 domain family protein 1 n=2 Tax=Loa loa TaxID=7209 RepID=A0A1S0UJ66_LOALO|nr:TSC22 domain family protein 1 [Loa loa]EJD74917.1 TSC22 domain family protein 1 [Loa loa]